MSGSAEYKKHYEQFSQNVEYAVRSWHHYVHLNNRAAEDAVILDALNEAARFWRDYNYSAVQTTVIFLGKIFDTDDDTFNVSKTIRSAHDDKAHFSKEKLRERKIELSGEAEWLDQYIAEASELDQEDIKAISAEVRKAKALWKSIKPLRDNVYAHHAMLNDEEREALFKNVKNSDIEDILQILLNISNALLQAEINGHKPDFSHNYIRPINHAQKDIEALIETITASP